MSEPSQMPENTPIKCESCGALTHAAYRVAPNLKCWSCDSPMAAKAEPSPTEPSQQARRAAQIIWETHDADGPPELIAAIIERETGVGEARSIIERLLNISEWGRNSTAHKRETEDEARAYLAKNQS
jgi:hypothetical protein